jgi:catechol 2,3-dioxygenase-like lactoylglutathione lyase family enzyme
MDNLYARSVFFVSDAERALRFYTEQLGFEVDWRSPPEGQLWVFQVSLFGFELILNQTWGQTLGREGHGRLYIGLEDNQGETFRNHLIARGIRGERVEWGRPTLVIRDVDGNELFFWLPHDDFTGLELTANESK